MVEVVVTDEFTEWFKGLDPTASDDVAESVDYLAVMGVRYLDETAQVE